MTKEVGPAMHSGGNNKGSEPAMHSGGRTGLNKKYK